MESWISTENFTTIIKKSFLYSRCCNILLSDSIYDVDILFYEFINIYPYGYVLHEIIYDCQGYFLLGSSDEEIEKAMRFVPSSISTIEILVIIDELKDTSKLFNVSLYGNSNANIVSKSGIWTLSENYLEARFFLKVNSYEELISEFKIVNMKGRELQVCNYNLSPFSYLNKTTTKIINGIEEEVFLADNDNEKDGIEIKMFLIIAEKLNFTWTIRKPKINYKYDRRVNITWLNDVCLQLVQAKKIDLAFGNIELTSKRNKLVNISTPWIQLSRNFLVPRPQSITNFWALIKPFSINCWILIIIMLVVKSIYMYTRARIDPKFPKRFRSIFCTITELIGRLVGIWVPRNTTNARFELHLWQTVGFLLVTAYCSSLAARLTNSDYEDRIDTVRQFVKANLSWGYKLPIGKPSNLSRYFDMDDIYAIRLLSKYIFVNDQEYVHTLIEKRKFAIYGSVLDSIFFPRDDVYNEYIKGYRLMKENTANYYASIIVQSWLIRPTDMIILQLKETGIAQFHFNDVFHRRANFNLREVVREHDTFDGISRRLGLIPLGAGFSVLIAGFLISTMIFFYELKQVAHSRPIREVFQDIQKKREIYNLSTYKKNIKK